MSHPITQLASTIPSAITRLNHLPAAQQQKIGWWAYGLAVLGTNLITPKMLEHQLKKSDLPPDEVRFNVQQESIRQIISGGVHVVSYFLMGGLVGRLLLNKAPQVTEQSRNLVQQLASIGMDFIGYAFVRPLISSELILNWLYDKNTPLLSPLLQKLDLKNPTAFAQPANSPHLSAGAGTPQSLDPVQRAAPALLSLEHRNADGDTYQSLYEVPTGLGLPVLLPPKREGAAPTTLSALSGNGSQGRAPGLQATAPLPLDPREVPSGAAAGSPRERLLALQ